MLADRHRIPHLPRRPLPTATSSSYPPIPTTASPPPPCRCPWRASLPPLPGVQPQLHAHDTPRPAPGRLPRGARQGQRAEVQLVRGRGAAWFLGLCCFCTLQSVMPYKHNNGRSVCDGLWPGCVVGSHVGTCLKAPVACLTGLPSMHSLSRWLRSGRV